MCVLRTLILGLRSFTLFFLKQKKRKIRDKWLQGEGESTQGLL